MCDLDSYNRYLPKDQQFDPDSIFREAILDLISKLAPKYTFDRRKDITKDDPDNRLASVPLEHPNVDPRWGCQINIYAEYTGPEDPSRGHEMAMGSVDSSGSVRWELDDRMRELINYRLHLENPEYVNGALCMKVKIHRRLRISKRYLFTFEYLGISKNPLISRIHYDGGDSIYYGTSTGNPHPEVFLTRRPGPKNSVDTAQEGVSTEGSEAKADVRSAACLSGGVLGRYCS